MRWQREFECGQQVAARLSWVGLDSSKLEYICKHILLSLFNKSHAHSMLRNTLSTCKHNMQWNPCVHVLMQASSSVQNRVERQIYCCHWLGIRRMSTSKTRMTLATSASANSCTYVSLLVNLLSTKLTLTPFLSPRIDANRKSFYHRQLLLGLKRLRKSLSNHIFIRCEVSAITR